MGLGWGGVEGRSGWACLCRVNRLVCQLAAPKAGSVCKSGTTSQDGNKNPEEPISGDWETLRGLTALEQPGACTGLTGGRPDQLSHRPFLASWG